MPLKADTVLPWTPYLEENILRPSPYHKFFPLLISFCEDLSILMEVFVDDGSTLVPDDRTERTLLSESNISPPSLCRFLGLPLEIRKRIYRHLCLSDVGYRSSHPRLWSPMAHRPSWRSTGYFERNSVLPLLLTCWQTHNEACPVLYGENLFAFHVSVVSQGPVLFLEWLAPKYLQLLREVYIRTGFNVDTYGIDCDQGSIRNSSKSDPSTSSEFQAPQDLSVSAALMKQAWPSRYSVHVNKEAILWRSKKDERAIWAIVEVNNWPRGAFHLWKLAVDTKENEDAKPEFRRILWVEDRGSHDPFGAS